MKKLSLPLALAAAAFMGGCSKPQPPAESAQPAAQQTPAPAEQSQPAPAAPAGEVVITASGLQYQDLAVGSGAEAKPGDHVLTHYTGWLTDGSKIDSSFDHGKPFEFQIGMSQVIQGWHEGVAGMKVGGRRKLTIPPSLGWGERGSPPVVPPDATVIFEIELLDVHTP